MSVWVMCYVRNSVNLSTAQYNEGLGKTGLGYVRCVGVCAIWVAVDREPCSFLDNKSVASELIADGPFILVAHLWARLASHYNPLRLLGSVLSGRFLSPIPGYEIRYDRFKHG